MYKWQKNEIQSILTFSVKYLLVGAHAQVETSANKLVGSLDKYQ